MALQQRLAEEKKIKSDTYKKAGTMGLKFDKALREWQMARMTNPNLKFTKFILNPTAAAVAKQNTLDAFKNKTLNADDMPGLFSLSRYKELGSSAIDSTKKLGKYIASPLEKEPKKPEVFDPEVDSNEPSTSREGEGITMEEHAETYRIQQEQQKQLETVDPNFIMGDKPEYERLNDEKWMMEQNRLDGIKTEETHIADQKNRALYGDSTPGDPTSAFDYENATQPEIKAMQSSIGVKPDGDWGDKSKEAYANSIQEGSGLDQIVNEGFSTDLPEGTALPQEEGLEAFKKKTKLTNQAQDLGYGDDGAEALQKDLDQMESEGYRAKMGWDGKPMAFSDAPEGVNPKDNPEWFHTVDQPSEEHIIEQWNREQGRKQDISTRGLIADSETDNLKDLTQNYSTDTPDVDIPIDKNITDAVDSSEAVDVLAEGDVKKTIGDFAGNVGEAAGALGDVKTLTDDKLEIGDAKAALGLTKTGADLATKAGVESAAKLGSAASKAMPLVSVAMSAKTLFDKKSTDIQKAGAVASAAGAIAMTNFWNPVGWVAGALTIGGTLAQLFGGKKAGKARRGRSQIRGHRGGSGYSYL
tara:strand:- start:334 stop:2085 length:1752 start_codon:yes stop_codon:yes gene_type:complete